MTAFAAEVSYLSIPKVPSDPNNTFQNFYRTRYRKYLVGLSQRRCNAHMGYTHKKEPKESALKRFLTACSLFLLALGSISYAATKESGSVSFPSTVRVGTNSLPAGTYAIHWQEGSSNEQVTISGNGHQISVPVTVAPGSGPDQVLIHRDGSGEVVDGFIVKETTFTIKNP
jgi:hypothetical protein